MPNGTLDPPALPRTLSRFDGAMIAMGTIIGIGIFITPRHVAAAAGSPMLVLGAWLLGSAIALTGAFTYAALGQALPHTGGPYVYLREGLGRLAAFLYGWMALTAIVSGALAVIGLELANYLGQFLAIPVGARPATAAGTILLLTAINVLGVRTGSRTQNALTLAKLAALAGLIAVGLARGTAPIDFEPLPEAAGLPWYTAIVAAMVPVLFSFGGWQNLSNVAGELRDPARDLKPAIVLAVAGVAAVYLLANVAYLRLLPIAELAAAEEPVSTALARAIGPVAGKVAAACILCSALGILNGLMLSTPRIYYAMALDGLMPKPFAVVHPRFRTPIVAILAQGLIAAGLCFWGNVRALLDYVVFADWLFFLLNALALFALVRRGALPARIRAFGYPYLPAAFALSGVAMTFGVMILKWANARWGVLLLCIGVIVYVTGVRRRSVA